ncbi:MAG TPA: hypothetical protein VMY88_01915 [Acidimicrobiales bacterium]|nr:hypothetical protein [Acidimicrobiales bacterium]
MGLFDKLKGTKRPADGVAPKSEAEVRAALLAINRATAPFVVREPNGDEKADLVAEWKIVDAQWYETFAKASLEKVFKVLMRFDAENNEVRAVDQEWSVEWSAGVPSLSLTAEKFRGQKTSVEFGQAFAFTENLEYGEVYKYKFATGEIKGPLSDAVTAAGWTWKAVAFGKL